MKKLGMPSGEWFGSGFAGELFQLRLQQIIASGAESDEVFQMLDPATVDDSNSFINRNTGSLTEPSATGGTWRHSDYIEIVAGTEYYFGLVNATATTAGLAWYDNEKNYVSGISATGLRNADNVLTAPNNSAYLRFSWRIDEEYNDDWEHTVWLCENGVCDHWTPYVDKG